MYFLSSTDSCGCCGFPAVNRPLPSFNREIASAGKQSP